MPHVDAGVTCARLSCLAPDLASGVRLLENAVVHFQTALSAPQQEVQLSAEHLQALASEHPSEASDGPLQYLPAALLCEPSQAG